MTAVGINRLLWQYVHGCRLISSASHVWTPEAERKRAAVETEGGADGVATSALAARASFERAGGWGLHAAIPTNAPTKQPSKAPSKAPTEAATAAVTEKATVAVTEKPTVASVTGTQGGKAFRHKKTHNNTDADTIINNNTDAEIRRHLAVPGTAGPAGSAGSAKPFAEPAWVWSWSTDGSITPTWVRQVELAMSIPPRALLQCALSDEASQSGKTGGLKLRSLKAPWLKGWQEESHEIGRIEPGWARGAERAFVARWGAVNQNSVRTAVKEVFADTIATLRTCVAGQEEKQMPLASQAGARERARAASCGGQAMLTWAASLLTHPEFSDDDPASTFERTFTKKPFGIALRATGMDTDGPNITALRSWARSEDASSAGEVGSNTWGAAVDALAAAHANSTLTAGAGASSAVSSGLWWGAAMLPPAASVAVGHLKTASTENEGVFADDLLVAVNGRDVSAMSLKVSGVC
jgi:hypothetical protein